MGAIPSPAPRCAVSLKSRHANVRGRRQLPRKLKPSVASFHLGMKPVKRGTNLNMKDEGMDEEQLKERIAELEEEIKQKDDLIKDYRKWARNCPE